MGATLSCTALLMLLVDVSLQKSKEVDLCHEVEFVVPDIAVDGKKSPFVGGLFRVRI